LHRAVALEGGVMRRSSLCLLGCLLAACGHPHPAPADGLSLDLQTGMAKTLASMGLPAIDELTAGNEAAQLAWSTDPRRISMIRDGTLNVASLHAEAQGVLRRIGQIDHQGKPPMALVWLAGHSAELDLDQRLLLEALTTQCVLELPAQAPVSLGD